MPILHVDPALLEYGSKLAETLRAMALSKRQGGIQAGVGTASMGYSSYSVGYNANTVNVRNGAVYNAAERSSINANAMANSKNMRVQGFELIDDNSAAIRRQMT